MALNVTKEVALLKQMTVGQLRERYLQVTGEATQAANRKWLVRRIIWRMQSIEEGGLSERAISRARELASGAIYEPRRPSNARCQRMPTDASEYYPVANSTVLTCHCGHSDHADVQRSATTSPRRHRWLRVRGRAIQIA